MSFFSGVWGPWFWRGKYYLAWIATGFTGLEKFVRLRGVVGYGDWILIEYFELPGRVFLNVEQASERR